MSKIEKLVAKADAAEEAALNARADAAAARREENSKRVAETALTRVRAEALAAICEAATSGNYVSVDSGVLDFLRPTLTHLHIRVAGTGDYGTYEVMQEVV